MKTNRSFIRCIETLLYKEWCNFLEYDYFRNLYPLKQFPKRLRRALNSTEKSLHRPLLYLPGVMKIQMRFYFAQERVRNGEDVHLFSSPLVDESSSNASRCANTDDILCSLKTSLLRNRGNKVPGLHEEIRYQQKNSLFEKSQPKNLLKTDCSSKKIKMKSSPWSSLAMKRTPTENSEQSLLFLCNSLPKENTFNESSISVILNRNWVDKTECSISDDTISKDVCFKKKVLMDRDHYRANDHTEHTSKPSLLKKSNKFLVHWSPKSRIEHSSSKKLKTEESGSCEKTLKQSGVRTSHKNWHDYLNPTPGLNRRFPPIPSHRKSLSANLLQTGRGNLISNKEQWSKLGSKTPQKINPEFSRPTHRPTYSSSNLQHRERVSQLEGFRTSAPSQKKSKKEKSTIDLQFSREQIKTSLKKPEKVVRTSLKRQKSENKIAQEPIHVNAFILQQSFNPLLYSDHKKSNILEKRKEKPASAKKASNFHQFLKASVPSKLENWRSILVEKFSKKVEKVERKNTFEAAPSRLMKNSHRRVISQAFNNPANFESPLGDSPIVPPPEIVRLDEPSQRHRRTKSMKAKFHSACELSGAPKQLPEKLERSQLKFSPLNFLDAALKKKVLDKLSRKP